MDQAADILLIIFLILYAVITLRFGPRLLMFGLRSMWYQITPPDFGPFSNHEGTLAQLIGAVAFFSGLAWIGLGLFAVWALLNSFTG